MAASIIIGLFGASLPMIRHLLFPAHSSDFGPVWFGANALLNHANPFGLVGPGLVFDWNWGLYYPGPALFVAVPFSFFTEAIAASLFAGISSFLLAYAVIAYGWFRLPLFISVPFITAASTAQWSVLFTAGLIVPSIGFFYASKPNLGLALCAAGSHRLRRWAIAGGLLLTLVSLIALPQWPLAWFHTIRVADHVRPLIERPGGFLALLAALRWRRPEARLILALVLTPITSAWYEVLPLFLIPNTLREMLYLTAAASLGSVLEQHVISLGSEITYGRNLGALIVALAVLPATLLVLLRPNARPAEVR